ncbi:MAG: hypothetical protein JO270_24800 [Acidobacteriaceae bacterium]|nr:hypothetical protein [Acidobacteriaceae bacterium]
MLRNMEADRVEVTRDEQHKRWLIRIQIGEEVIRRYTHEPKDASQDTLRIAAVKIAGDEGYTVNPAHIVVSRP